MFGQGLFVYYIDDDNTGNWTSTTSMYTVPAAPTEPAETTSYNLQVTTAGLASWEPVADSGGGGSFPTYSALNVGNVNSGGTPTDALANQDASRVIIHPDPGTEMRFILRIMNGQTAVDTRLIMGSNSTSGIVTGLIEGIAGDPFGGPVGNGFLGSWNTSSERFDVAFERFPDRIWEPGDFFGNTVGGSTFINLGRAGGAIRMDLVLTGHLHVYASAATTRYSYSIVT